ncbi:MAG TPA: VOC family protein [Gaiellaceae bacterium]|nr:VOC family protein [Gaiellaceae bacterium]
MTAPATAIGTFVWHEQVSSAPKQAQGFYTQLFGWGVEMFEPGEMEYAMISSGGQVHGGFGSAQEGAPPPHWLGHVRVESLEETIEQAKAAGGRLAAGPFDLGQVGRTAIIADPQGAFVSAYQPAGDAPAPAGVFVWDELGTTDADAAERFYGAVFGWTAVDMGPEYGGYRIFQRGDTRVGGMMALADASIPPRWQPYVAVEDADETAARARKLAASVLLEPMDVPDVGRIAVLRDPQGAPFGVIAAQTPA